MLNFMCTALKNYFLLYKIRFRRSLRNQELYLLSPYVNKELETRSFSRQLLKADSEVSGYFQGDFDKNNSEIKVLLTTKGEEYQNIVSLFTPKQEEHWFYQNFSL